MSDSRTASHWRSGCWVEMLLVAIGTLAAVLVACSSAATPKQSLPLKLIRDILLPGRATRFDNESLDLLQKSFRYLDREFKGSQFSIAVVAASDNVFEFCPSLSLSLLAELA